MSITVDELNDFVATSYAGKTVAYNVEDLKFIAKRAEASPNNTYYDGERNFRFAYIRDINILALDEGNLEVKKLAAAYRITLANPPLVNYPFNLAFTSRSSGPPAVKLMEALRAIGYQGPEVVDLAQINMYMLAIAPPVPAYIKYNYQGPALAMAKDVWYELPMNITAGIPTSSDIISTPLTGTFYISRPGIYQFSGAWCAEENRGMQRTALTINGGAPDTAACFKDFDDYRFSGFPAVMPSIRFTFTEYITPALIAASPNALGAIVRIMILSTVATNLLTYDLNNWMTITRLGG